MQTIPPCFYVFSDTDEDYCRPMNIYEIAEALRIGDRSVERGQLDITAVFQTTKNRPSSA